MLPVTTGALVLTHDTLVEGVHCRRDDPPESYGWKLAAANLSDLAAKGAEPVGCLLSYPLARGRPVGSSGSSAASTPAWPNTRCR